MKPFALFSADQKEPEFLMAVTSQILNPLERS